MTETPEAPRPPVVPEGKHWSNLTVAELGYAGRELGADIINATATRESPHRLEAYAWVAYLWARRTDPAVKVKQFMDLELTEIARLIRLNVARTEDPADTPTDSRPGSSSPAPGDASPTTS